MLTRNVIPGFNRIFIRFDKLFLTKINTNPFFIITSFSNLVAQFTVYPG
jgi:hypothetical protein